MSDTTDRPIRVLLVDDEADFLQPVSFWLRSKGYDVATAPNGEDAMERIAREVPDIVFMDINMPGMNGLETLRSIRATNQKLPVIMVTAAYQNEKYFAEANSLGISGFFPKSHSLSELAAIIETSLRAHTRRKPASDGEKAS